MQADEIIGHIGHDEHDEHDASASIAADQVPASAFDACPAPWWYGLLVVITSGLIEHRYLHRGLNLLDEGWALYAAMQLHQGGTLYRDILWVFPPAHTWMAWIGYAIDPPGIIATRILYALWTVGLCFGCYELGRRIMPRHFALLGGLMLAFAAPRTHTMQLLFGYRYMLLAVLAMLAFHRRLRTDDSRWMLAAGVLAGIAVSFRLTPAFAVSVGISIGVMLASGDWRRWIRDWALFGGGLLIILIPVFAWFANSVGIATFVREIVVHPLEMLQPLPVPDLVWPMKWNRYPIESAFWRLEFRLYTGLYLGYGLALAWSWIRCFRAGRAFRHTFLASVVIFGAVFYLRSHGRADESHLDSTMPINCVLLAHATSVLFRRLRERPALPLLRSGPAAPVAALLVLSLWIFLLGSDRILRNVTKDLVPLGGIPETLYLDPGEAKVYTSIIEAIRQSSGPDDTILPLSASPLFYVMTGRRGPGTRDVVMPGTFYDDADEAAFVETIAASPPAVIVWPHVPFDNRPDRAITVTAPRIVQWVMPRYQRVLHTKRYSVFKYAGEPH